MQADQFTITNPEVLKKVTKAMIGERYSYTNWCQSVRRLSIFVDQPIKTGVVQNGQVDKETRFNVMIILKKFWEKDLHVVRWERTTYKDVAKEENRAFSNSQYDFLRHVIAGGLISGI